MSTTRRGLLGGAAALMTAPAISEAATAVHPDAELIRLAEQFIANEHVIRAEPCNEKPGTAEAEQADWRMGQLTGQQRTLASHLGALRASTAEGIAALARCLAVHNADLAFSMEDPDTTTGMLVRQIIRDAAPKGMATVTAPSPDAELLEACAAFDELERAYIAVPGNYAPGSPEEEEADAERDRIAAAQAPLVDRICELRAVTREGLAARARSLALWDGELMKDCEGDVGEWFTAAIVRDLIG